MKRLILLFAILLSGCTTRHPDMPLGRIVLYRAECKDVLSCNYVGISQCPLGFHIETYEDNIMLFYCVSWGIR